MLEKLVDTIRNYRVTRFINASRHRDKLYELPDDLCSYWAQTAADEFKGIPRDAFFFVRAADALMDFFDAVAASEQPCGLPSKAADSVWHAWLRIAPLTLQQFCIAHFGRPIPHREAATMPVPMDQAMAACLVASRRRRGMAAGGAKLPPLFTADRRLRMPHGYSYSVVLGRVGWADMDERGRVVRLPEFPNSWRPEELASAGLLTAWEFEQVRRQQPGTWEAGTSSDSGSGSDGSGDGGGGDGGGCGGCGGGCG